MTCRFDQNLSVTVASHIRYAQRNRLVRWSVEITIDRRQSTASFDAVAGCPRDGLVKPVVNPRNHRRCKPLAQQGTLVFGAAHNDFVGALGKTRTTTR